MIIVFVLFIGLFTKRLYGITLGMTIGFLIDVFIGKKIGISAVLLGLIGAAGGFLEKNFSKDSKITIIAMVILATIFYEFFNYMINSVIFMFTWEMKTFIIKLLIEVIYNSILTILLYPLIQKTGFNIENMFKENNILTRYY